MTKRSWLPIILVVGVVLVGLAGGVGALAMIYRVATRPAYGPATSATLLYEIEGAPGSDLDGAIRQARDLMRSRTDRSRIRVVDCRRQGERQVALSVQSQTTIPWAEIVAYRQEYLAARAALLHDTLTRADLDRICGAAPAERRDILEKAAAGRPQRRMVLDAVVAAHDGLAAARQPYEAAQAAVRQAEAKLGALSAAAPADRRAQQQQEVEARVREIVPATEAFVAARARYSAAVAAALEDGVTLAEWESVSMLPSAPAPTGDGARRASARDQAIEALGQRHPDHAREIQAAARAWATYERAQGPLETLAPLVTGATLEFRIAPAPADVPDLAQYREQLATDGPGAGADRPYRWFELFDPRRFAEGQNPSESREMLKALEADPAAYFARRGEIAASYNGKAYLLLANSADASMSDAQPKWAVTHAGYTVDSRGMPAIAFELNTAGGELMAALTGNHVHKPLAIVLDARVISSPTIQSRIMRNGQITGGRNGFSREETDYLVRVLNAPRLPIRLSPYPLGVAGPSSSRETAPAGAPPAGHE